MTRWLAVVVVVSSCGPALLPGAPAPGTKCTDEKPECMTSSSLGVCDTVAGVWFEQPCANRCSNEQETKCEFTTPKVGDACPRSWEDYGACESSTSLLKCVDGKWSKSSMACPNCHKTDFGLSCA